MFILTRKLLKLYNEKTCSILYALDHNNIINDRIALHYRGKNLGGHITFKR